MLLRNSNKFINSIDEDGSIDLDKGELLFFIDTKELFKYNDNEESTNIPEGQSKGDDRKDYKMTENDYEELTIDNVEDVTRVKTDEVINEKVMETNKNDIFETIEDADILPVLDE